MAETRRRRRHCLLCSAYGSTVLNDASSTLLCQEMEEKGQVISCAKDGTPFLSELDDDDAGLLFAALQIDKPEVKPTFCSANCFQTIARITTMQLELNLLIDEVVVRILESESEKSDNLSLNEMDFHTQIRNRWSEKGQFKVSVKVEEQDEDVGSYSPAQSPELSPVPSPEPVKKKKLSKAKIVSTPSTSSNPKNVTGSSRRSKRLHKVDDDSGKEEEEGEMSKKSGKRRKIERSNTKNVKEIEITSNKKSTEKRKVEIPGSGIKKLREIRPKESTEQKKDDSNKDDDETGARIKCGVCSIPFKRDDHFAIHNENVHSVLTQDYSKIGKTERYSCKYCDKKFGTLSMLKSHQHCHIRKKPSACPVCSKVFENDVDMFHHKMIHDGPFICDCGKILGSQEELSLHQGQGHNHSESDNNESSPHKCDVCERTFAILSNLEEHRKVHPSFDSSKLYKCDLCEEIFGVKYYLHKHLALQHRVPEYLHKFDSLCHLCGKDFTLKKVMLAHLKTHTHKNELIYPCKECPEKFLTRHARRQHEASVHRGVPNIFKCNYCTETFKFLIASRRHMVQEHEEHKALESFHCKVCFRTFAVQSLLDDHAKSHEKLTCKFCGKACTSKQRLEMHETIHTGEKKFSCDICDKSFRHTANLNKHKLEQHTGGRRPWKCPRCKPRKFYKRKQHLRLHLQKDHGEDLESFDPSEVFHTAGEEELRILEFINAK